MAEAYLNVSLPSCFVVWKLNMMAQDGKGIGGYFACANECNDS